MWWDELAKGMARWYLFHMPTFERPPWTWEVYDMAMKIVYGEKKNRYGYYT